MGVPLVSILCPTYNHELYIADAIDGFLMQKTDFDFEIIIHDDASTDKTSEIAKSYESKYPGKFNNIYQIENQFSKDIMSVSRILFKAAKGKYIALCEGDDYWTDSNKLKKQIDVLEQNPNITAVFHNTEERCFDGLLNSRLYINKMNTSQIVSIHEMHEFNIVPTSSLVFRKSYLPAEINTLNFSKLHFGDWPLNLLLARNGDFYYFPFIMSVRRMHQNSIWGMQEHSENIRKTVESLNAMISYNWFDKEVNIKLERTIESLQNKNKSKGLMHYLLNKIINVLVKIKNKT
jgi:glycosyltransferase involved in cell wall biosynthesis